MEPDLAEENAALRERIRELEAEAFALSAGVCPHLRGNEHGNAYCGKTNELI